MSARLASVQTASNFNLPMAGNNVMLYNALFACFVYRHRKCLRKFPQSALVLWLPQFMVFWDKGLNTGLSHGQVVVPLSCTQAWNVWVQLFHSVCVPLVLFSFRLLPLNKAYLLKRDKYKGHASPVYSLMSSHPASNGLRNILKPWIIFSYF